MKISSVGGLCNRLRIMLGYQAVCSRKGETLEFLWEQNRYATKHNGEFSVPGVDIQTTRDNHVPIASSTMFQGIANTILGGHDRDFEITQWRSIQWSDRVREMAKQGAMCGLAVHVRRTDHDGWHKLTTDDFVRRTAEVMRREGFRALPIYLSTDGKDTFDAFTQEFGANNLRHIPKDYTLPYQTDLTTACADLLACSQARFFIGTRNSSFTDGIRSLRGEPLDAAQWGPDYGYSRHDTASQPDLAVIACHFNFAGYDRPRANLHRFCRRMERDGAQVFGVEAYLSSQEPITKGIAGWVQVQVPRHAIAFQKEALLNAAEKLVPQHYTKLAWVDADIEFTNPDWVKETSLALEAYNVVQPYDTAVWMGVDGQEIQRLQSTAALAQPGDAVLGHPGFAYAARRELWTRYGGLFPYSATGRGDAVAGAAFFGKPLSDLQLNSIGGTMESRAIWRQWAEPIADWTGGKVGLVAGSALHEYHGDKTKRKYAERHIYIDGMNILRDLEITQDGYLQWTSEADPIMMAAVAQHFAERDEDG